MIRPSKLRSLLEFYPSQNRVIAAKLGGAVGMPAESLFVGNGAVEIIQAILHRFTKSKLLVNLPTFSPYYEFARPDTQVVYNVLRKEDNFRFDPEAYLGRFGSERPDTIVLINPNNPDGGYVSHTTLRRPARATSSRPATSSSTRASFTSPARATDFCLSQPGGLGRPLPEPDRRQEHVQGFRRRGHPGRLCRDGPNRVRTLLENGYLWNSSGLAEYFFDLYSRPEFQVQYERKRIRFIRQFAAILRGSVQS